MKLISKIENARYSATISHNNYLGECISVAYELTGEEVKEGGFTDKTVLILLKIKNEEFPFENNKRETLFGKGTFVGNKVPLRIMSSCMTGLLGDKMCECHDDMVKYLKTLGARDEGIFVYLPQEGQGRGLKVKLRDHRLQYGFDDMGKRIVPKTFREATSYLIPNSKFDIRKFGFLKDCFSLLGLDMFEFGWLGGENRIKQLKSETGLRVSNLKF